MGFLTLLRRVGELWEKSGDKLREDGKTLARYVKQELEQPRAAVEVVNCAPNCSPRRRRRSRNSMTSCTEDSVSGRMRRDVPSSPNRRISCSWPIARRAKDRGSETSPSQAQLVNTLDHMARGGIRDHLGGGFHRYSVDRFWRIPHFEKMLYDNAQLITAYAEGHALSGRADFRRVAEEIIAFSLRELEDPQGGFYSALDAESEGEEGRFYRWEKEAARRLLADDQWQLFAETYGLDGAPNFEEQYYVPQLAASLPQLADARKQSFEQFDEQLQPLRAKLLAERDRRPRPLTDTKILASWNGLMIRGLADAGRIFREPRHVAAAVRTAEFVLAKLRLPDGRLARTRVKGRPGWRPIWTTMPSSSTDCWRCIAARMTSGGSSRPTSCRKNRTACSRTPRAAAFSSRRTITNRCSRGPKRSPTAPNRPATPCRPVISSISPRRGTNPSTANSARDHRVRVDAVVHRARQHAPPRARRRRTHRMTRRH